MCLLVWKTVAAAVMSETDDTDVLLLIPPDFFRVHSSGSEESLLESSRTVVPKPKSCTAQVIGKLLSQVHCLESRLETLEISTTITDSSFGTLPRRNNCESSSLDSHSFDRKWFTFPRRRRRKLSKRKQDSSLVSLDSIRKSIPPLRLSEELASLSSKPTTNAPSMDGDISSIVSTPTKKNDKLLLHEIDEFLTKVENYESPETKYKGCELSEVSLSPENVIKATGDYMTSKIDSKNVDNVRLPSGRIVSNSILEKYIYLVRNGSGNSSNGDAPSSSAQNNKIESQNSGVEKETPKVSETSKVVQESKSPSVRRLNFATKQTMSDVQPTSTPKKSISSNYIDTFKPSSNKIYDKATKVLEQYKSQNYSRTSERQQSENTQYSQNYNRESNIRYTERRKELNDCYTGKQNNPRTESNLHDSLLQSNYLLNEDFKIPQMRPYVHDNKDLKNRMMNTIDTELLSLSELWGERDKDKERGDSNKLEEERLKREHCESMIQELQKKLLDQQERLAVAVKVDRAKDAAILKLKEAWLKLTSSLERAEDRHRAALENMLREVDVFKIQADEAQKKSNHFEAELYKAIDLAHDYQEKCKHLANRIQQIQDAADKETAGKDQVVASREHEIEVLKENYDTLMRLNKQSADCVRNLEDLLAKERTEHEQTRSQMTELHRKLQAMQDNSTLAVQERDALRDKVTEERARCSMLERQLCDQHRENGEMDKRCEALDNEVKTLRKHIELQKVELKSHYQKQLEDAVLAKLQEFQTQLDQARREMEHEARESETKICDTFQKQMARIEEQHKLEVNVLEEKHREEIKLYRLQLAQASERIGLLESKLDSYRRRRGQIASQLHSVMEAQWRQALYILTNGQRGASSLDITRADSVSTPAAQDYGPPKVPPLAMSFGRERDGAYPSLQRERDGDSNMFNLEGLSDRDLQQYVKLLLTKPPNMDGSGDAPRELTGGSDPHKGGSDPHRGGQAERGFDLRRDLSEEPTSDRADKKSSSKRSLGGVKPPWKA